MALRDYLRRVRRIRAAEHSFLAVGSVVRGTIMQQRGRQVPVTHVQLLRGVLGVRQVQFCGLKERG